MTNRFLDKVGEHTTSNPEETRSLARTLAAELRLGDLVALRGDLGAGKTVFAQGLGEGLGVSSDILVRSPTFAIFNLHQGPRPMVHVDLYRIDNPEEIEALGLLDLLDSSVVVVEWAEKAGTLLKPPDLVIFLTHVPEDENARRVRIKTPNSVSPGNKRSSDP